MIGLVQTGFQWFGARVLAAVDQRIIGTLHQAGSEWLAMSRVLAPVKTGELRMREGYRVEGKTLVLEMGAPHDIYQEFGTRRIPPRPHVRPALNAIGRIFGGQIEMQFNVMAQNNPVFAHQAGFIVPKGLTRKQLEHIRTRLMPVSKQHYRGNVRRARMRVRRAP